MEERYDFDGVTILAPVATGMPGQRTFFLAVGEKGNWVRAWLEKEQLQALALAIEQFLFTLADKHSRVSPETEVTPLPGDAASGLPSAELEIDEIALGYEDGKATLILSAHPSGPQRLNQAVVYCRTTLPRIKQLGDQAAKVCAAGRPRCILCGGPIDPGGHICPRSN